MSKNRQAVYVTIIHQNYTIELANSDQSLHITEDKEYINLDRQFTV